MRLFDTHSHIQERAFESDLDATIARAREAGLVGLVVCGYDAPGNQRVLEMAARHDFIHPTVGFHPHDASDVTPAMLDTLEEQASQPDVVAVGEIGLDFYRRLSPPEVQRAVIDAQLAIAARTGKPVCVHSRSAEDDIYPHLAAYAERSPLRAMGRPPGVMHAFGGTLEQARRYVELGFLVSITCTATYPKNEEARRIARELPLDRLVIETDSPYLPPQPLRGKRNEPALVGYAAEAIATARGITIQEAAEATTANAAALFGVSIPTLAGGA